MKIRTTILIGAALSAMASAVPAVAQTGEYDRLKNMSGR